MNDELRKAQALLYFLDQVLIMNSEWERVLSEVAAVKASAEIKPGV